MSGRDWFLIFHSISILLSHIPVCSTFFFFAFVFCCALSETDMFFSFLKCTKVHPQCSSAPLPWRRAWQNGAGPRAFMWMMLRACNSATLISGIIIEKLMWDSAGKELKDGNIINAISLVSGK